MVNPTRRPVPTLGQPFAPGSNNQNTRTTDVNQDLTLCHLHEQQVGNDGNCLFRSVSHQIYGTEDHHELIRRKCVEYMRCNEGWFSQYVAEDFSTYCDRKEQDAEWGDDVELQALSEIYTAQIIIYNAANHQAIVRQFNTGQRLLNHGRGTVGAAAAASGAASSSAAPPVDEREPTRTIRLLYRGNSHYNSLVVTQIKIGAGQSASSQQPRSRSGGGAASSQHRYRDDSPDARSRDDNNGSSDLDSPVGGSFHNANNGGPRNSWSGGARNSWSGASLDQQRAAGLPSSATRNSRQFIRNEEDVHQHIQHGNQLRPVSYFNDARPTVAEPGQLEDAAIYNAMTVQKAAGMTPGLGGGAAGGTAAAQFPARSERNEGGDNGEGIPGAARTETEEQQQIQQALEESRGVPPAQDDLERALAESRAARQREEDEELKRVMEESRGGGRGGGGGPGSGGGSVSAPEELPNAVIEVASMGFDLALVKKAYEFLGDDTEALLAYCASNL